MGLSCNQIDLYYYLNGSLFLDVKRIFLFGRVFKSSGPFGLYWADHTNFSFFVLVIKEGLKITHTVFSHKKRTLIQSYFRSLFDLISVRLLRWQNWAEK